MKIDDQRGRRRTYRLHSCGGRPRIQRVSTPQTPFWDWIALRYPDTSTHPHYRHWTETEVAASLVTFTMPGLVGVTTASSSSDENEVAVPGSTPPTSDDGGQYPAASFPGYAEKPLNEQLEPIALIGMGKCHFLTKPCAKGRRLELGKKQLTINSSLSVTRRCWVGIGLLGHDDQQEDGPNAQGPIFTFQH